MKLFGFVYSHNTRRVLVAAHELGITLDFESVNLIAKESYTPEFKRKNPNGLTPVLADGDFTLWELMAIVQYLCNQSGDPAIYPQAAQARAKIDQWCHWNGRHWDAVLDPIIIQKLIMPLEGKDTDQGVVERNVARAKALTEVLDSHLHGREFVCDTGFSIADIAIASLVDYHKYAALPLDGCDNIMAWFERVTSRPSWEGTEPDWSVLTQ